MAKILTGKVVSTKMQGTIVVKVSSVRPHPIYKKIIRRDKKIKVARLDFEVKEGDTVKIVETKPLSKDKNFKVHKVLKQ